MNSQKMDEITDDPQGDNTPLLTWVIKRVLVRVANFIVSQMLVNKP